MEESWTTVIYAVAGFLTECIACIQSMLALLGRRFYRPQFDGFHESTWILHIHFWCIHGILHPKYSLCWHEKSSTLRPIPRSLILFPYAKSNLSFEEWKLRLFCVMFYGEKLKICLIIREGERENQNVFIQISVLDTRNRTKARRTHILGFKRRGSVFKLGHRHTYHICKWGLTCWSLMKYKLDGQLRITNNTDFTSKRTDIL